KGLNSPKPKLIRDGGDLTNPEPDKDTRRLDERRKHTQERASGLRSNVPRRLRVEIQPNCIRASVGSEEYVVRRGDTANLDPGHGDAIVFCFVPVRCLRFAFARSVRNSARTRNVNI